MTSITSLSCCDVPPHTCIWVGKAPKLFFHSYNCFSSWHLILWWSFLQVLCSSIIQLVASYFKTHLVRNFIVMVGVEMTVPKLLSFLSSLHPVYQQSWPPGMPVHTPLLSDWCFFPKVLSMVLSAHGFSHNKSLVVKTVYAIWNHTR